MRHFAIDRYPLRGWLFALSMALVCLGVLTPAVATAQNDEGVFNKLLAPGPLIEGHKDLEHGKCLSCHETGKGIPDKNCLSCHEDIAKSKATKTSFHARVKGNCISCHKDHKGRNFDNTKFNQKTFNHKLTGFHLKGSHAKVPCKDCHVKQRKDRAVRKTDPVFFGLTKSCNSCHQKDDPHKFPPKWAKKSCGSCHNEVKWKQALFDHGKETGHELVGRHKTLPCKTCHNPKGKPAKYDFPQLETKNCLTCHKDFHGTKLGPKFRDGNCSSCHNQFKWPIKGFDHSVTGFDLRGRHASVSCATCHGPKTTRKNAVTMGKGRSVGPNKNLNFTGLNSQCSSCHGDFHGYDNERSPILGFLRNCATCHTEVKFKPIKKFNHSTQTSFIIDGKHTTVKCFDCHTPQNKPVPQTKKARKRLSKSAFIDRHYMFPNLNKKTCETCHASPHTRSTNPVFKTRSCDSCHSTSGWLKIATRKDGFDHNSMTKFPLTGAHRKVKSCNTCHLKNGKKVMKFPGAKQGFCKSCHTDVHKKLPPSGQFSKRIDTSNCSKCHTTHAFGTRLLFDHDKTRFPLKDAHARIDDCHKCHKPTRQLLTKGPTSMEPRLKRKLASNFQFKNSKTGFCESCHPSVHKKQFDREFASKPCRECHTQKSFKKRLPFDHNQTAFKLTGAHRLFKGRCSKCHKISRDVLPSKPPRRARRFQFPGETNQFCESCHPNQHRDQFRKVLANKPCVSCHTTSKFTYHGKFPHNKWARFAIKGKHKNVKCRECHIPTDKRFKTKPFHRKGKFHFKGLKTKTCAECHIDPHKGSYGKNCDQCHTESGWKRAGDFHKNFNLTGVHYLLACSECHANDHGRKLTGTGDDCISCHMADDVHRGTQPNCKECHSQTFWNASVFQHSLTDFPLRGIHRLLDCKSCHQTGVYKGLGSDCANCHQQDALKVVIPNHSAPGFENCTECHNEFSFK